MSNELRLWPKNATCRRSLPPSQRSIRGLPTARREAEAWVYVMQCRSACKIGATTADPAKRLSSMQGGNPFPIRLVFSRRISLTLALTAEHEAMRALEAHHIHGEWFRCSRAAAILAVERALPPE